MTKESFDILAATANADKKWEEMTIVDDPIFGAVMENHDLCQELLQRSLPELKIARLQTVEAQQTVIAGLDTHGVRYDIYGEDDKGDVFEVEMQVLPQSDIVFRARFYQAMLDQKLLRHSQQYGELAKHPTYVVFFCDFDPFQRGDARYHFENFNRYHRGQALGDGRQIVFFNAKASSFTHAKEIRSFLDLMQDRVDTKDKYIDQLQAEIARIKTDSGRKGTFMKLEVDYQRKLWETKQEALAEGEKRGIEIGEERGEEKGRQTGILAMISLLEEQGKTAAEILATISAKFNLTPAEAEHYLRLVP